MRKIPICKVCAKTGVLCSSCDSKLQSGEVSQLEIDISKELLELEKKFTNLKNVSLYKVIEKDDLIVLIVGKGDLNYFKGDHSKIRWILQEEYNKNIRIIEKSKNPKKVLEDLISPIPVLGINQIYLPTGEIENKARVSEKDFERLSIDVKVLEDIIHSLTGTAIRIVFE
ncbi:MAG: hypothetical protein ACTSRP_22020 [Candidatus Helarchaeota archaeon]